MPTKRIVIIPTALLVFLLIVFLLPRYFYKGDTSYNFAEADIRYISKSLELFYSDKGRFPTTEDGLEILLNSYVDRLPKDPWGNPYNYVYPGQHNKNSFDLWSNGADGKPGGEDENRDITNWKPR
jgi:general secretion pathway protein G